MVSGGCGQFTLWFYIKLRSHACALKEIWEKVADLRGNPHENRYAACTLSPHHESVVWISSILFAWLAEPLAFFVDHRVI
jgi:hypothetical protein